MKKWIFLLFFPVLVVCNNVDEMPFIDNDPPILVAAKTLDLDVDGFVETIQVVFNERIDDMTINPDDFSLDLIGALEFRFDTNGDKSRDELIHLSFVDGFLALDVTPVLTYTKPANPLTGTRDVEGNRLETSQIQVQAADPVP